MEITVLGKSPAVPDADGASSGYLLTDGDHRVLVDCGTGVFAKLRAVCEPTDVQVIVITHLHADHIIDLVPYSHALGYVYQDRGIRPLLLAPPGSIDTLGLIADGFGVDSQIQDAFEIREYDPAQATAIPGFTVTFQEVPHFIRAWAVDLRADDGKRFTFGADCAPNDVLAPFALQTDLLLLEATEGVTAHAASDQAPRGHMTAREAGELARQAHARRLVVTHFSDLLDADEIRQEAQAGFGAEVEMAHGGASFSV